MKKIKFILMMAVLIICPLIANAADTIEYKWDKRYTGINFNSFYDTLDGYVVAADRYVGYKAKLIKFNYTGQIEWEIEHDTTNDSSFADVIKSGDNYYAVGNEYFSTSVADAIVIKYDKNQNLVWKKVLKGGSYDEFYSLTDVGDGLVAVGYTWSNNQDFSHNSKYTGGIIVKYDYNGNLIWKKTFGGTGRTFFEKVIPSGNGIIVVGRTTASDYDMQGHNSNSDEWVPIIVKYAASGNVEWVSADDTKIDSSFLDVIEVSDGYVAVGYTGNATGAIIAKYNKTGSLVWSKANTGYGTFSSVIPVSNGYMISAIPMGVSTKNLVSYNAAGEVVDNYFNYAGLVTTTPVKLFASVTGYGLLAKNKEFGEILGTETSSNVYDSMIARWELKRDYTDLEARVRITCDKTDVKKGDTVTCDVFFNEFLGATVLAFDLSVGDAFNITNYNFYDWGDNVSGKRVTLTSSLPVNVQSNVAVMTITMIATKDHDVALVSAKSAKVTDALGVEVDAYEDSATINIGNSIPNPETGAYISIAILSISAIMAVGLLLYTKKQKVIYNV